jgi:hypothetical protein
MLGVLAANSLGFSLALDEAWLWLKSTKLLAGTDAKGTWHVQNQPHRAFTTL